MRTFEARTCDDGVALDACRMLVQAYDDAEESETADAGTVGEALGTAAAAFPGLVDFVEEALADGLEEDAISIATSLVTDSILNTVQMEAAAGLALLGAICEFGQGFDWSDIDRIQLACREAMEQEEAPAAPGF